MFPNASVVKLEGTVSVGTQLGNCFCYSYSMGTSILIVLDSIDSNLAQYLFLALKIWYERKVSFPMCVLCVVIECNFAISW